MSIFINGRAYEYANTQFVPTYNRLFGTERAVAGNIVRTDSTVLERGYKFTLLCTNDQFNTLLTSFMLASVVTFIDEMGTQYNVYFMEPLSFQMVNPTGVRPCNDFTVDVTLMVDGQT